MTAKTRFRGSFTALVTPFKNGSVDEKGFRDLVDWRPAYDFKQGLARTRTIVSGQNELETLVFAGAAK